MLTKDKRSQRGIYQEFMAQENFGEIHHMFEKKNLPSVLGSEKFIEWVKDRFFQQKSHEEIPESRQLAPERETIKQVVCNEYQV
jgi:putative transposase